MNNTQEHVQTALESASDSIEDNSKKVLESSSVDFVNVGKENEHLALRILVFETWIGFELPVKNILVKEVDVLRAQVIDVLRAPFCTPVGAPFSAPSGACLCAPSRAHERGSAPIGAR